MNSKETLLLVSNQWHRGTPNPKNKELLKTRPMQYTVKNKNSLQPGDKIEVIYISLREKGCTMFLKDLDIKPGKTQRTTSREIQIVLFY